VTEADVELAVGFGPEHRSIAADLYWDAFGRKLEKAIGPRKRGIALIERGLDPTRAVVALQDGELVGLAGFQLEGRALTRVGVRDIIKEFGFLRSVKRIAWASILHRDAPDGVLLMDGIVVKADHRGHGIGSKLLTRVFEVAAEHGKRVIRLDVVDTNPAAHRLYQRMGFVPTKTEKVPFIRKALGFSAATTMERPVGT